MVVDFNIDVPPNATHADVTGKMLVALKDYITAKDLKLMSFPEFSDAVREGNKVRFKANIIERPKIRLCGYKDIPLRTAHKSLPLEDIDKIMDFELDLRKKAGEDTTKEKLAKDKGYYDLKAWRSHIHKIMLEERDRENNKDFQRQLKDYLVAKCGMTVPKDYLEALTEMKYAEEVNSWLAQGKDEASIPKNGKDLIRNNVEADIKFICILDEIAEKERITGPNPYPDVIEFLIQEAQIE